MEPPRSGFYMHFKHDPHGAPGNYMYEVVGCAKDAETEALLVLYRPLYNDEWFKPAQWCVRPVAHFIETVTRGEKQVPRFSAVTDRGALETLSIIRRQMYDET